MVLLLVVVQMAISPLLSVCKHSMALAQWAVAPMEMMNTFSLTPCHRVQH
jgi:hypothetical protein